MGSGFSWMIDWAWDGPEVDFLCAVVEAGAELWCLTGGATGKFGLAWLVSWTLASGKPIKGCICCCREWGIGLIVAGFNFPLKDVSEEGPSTGAFLSSEVPFTTNKFDFDSEPVFALSLVREADHLGRWKYGPLSPAESFRWPVQKKRRRSASCLSNEATGVAFTQPTPSATRLLYEISGARCFKT